MFLFAGSPRVGIIMGSDSDLPVMKEAAKVLREFDVPIEVSSRNFCIHFKSSGCIMFVYANDLIRLYGF